MSFQATTSVVNASLVNTARFTVRSLPFMYLQGLYVDHQEPKFSHVCGVMPDNDLTETTCLC